MTLRSHKEYEAAVQRAATLRVAPEGSPEAAEFLQLAAEIQRWSEAHEDENGHGPDPSHSFLTSDDLPFSGLPGNLGKLKKD